MDEPAIIFSTYATQDRGLRRGISIMVYCDFATQHHTEGFDTWYAVPRPWPTTEKWVLLANYYVYRTP